MAEQETTVMMPPVGASGRRRQLSSDTVQLNSNSHTMSTADTMGRMTENIHMLQILKLSFDNFQSGLDCDRRFLLIFFWF